MKGAVSAQKALFGALQRPSTRLVLPELQRHKDSIRCVELGAEVPGYLPSTTTDANLDCAFVENAPFYIDR